MKKIKQPKWKKKKRHSFHFYFILYVGIVLIISLAISSWVSPLIVEWLSQWFSFPDFVMVILLGLIIGITSSTFVGKVVLSPIKKIRDSMTEVSEGNLNISINEASRFDEIEDVNHAFNIMVKELRSTEIIQSDFVSNVSHEFKTPLTAIEGYTTMLQADDLSEEEIKEYTNKILFNTNRMSKLVQNILLISKLDNQGIDSKKEIFSIDEQIRQEILATETTWLEKNIDFDVDLDSVQFYGNSSLTSHVWSNLLGNAIKFSPNGGKIIISLKKLDTNLVFSISDEGEGINEDSKKYIFNKFYQLDTSHKQEGNGLGLALVKKILDIYDGEIDVQNLENKGCKFTVKLPL